MRSRTTQQAVYYTEPWPEDLAVRRDEKCHTKRAFRRSFEKRAAYEAGDGVADLAVYCWGNGRLEPKEMPRSRQNTFVDVAAGPRHTLAVSRDGLVYACGEGLKGQLGVENKRQRQPTSAWLCEDGATRARYLTRTLASSVIDARTKAGVRVERVAASSTASFGCEAASNSREMVEALLARAEALEKWCGKDTVVSRLRAALRQEALGLTLTARGRLVVWGHGRRGELGLGEHVLHHATPTVVPALAKHRVVTLAAGRYHVLALCAPLWRPDVTAVYSWGWGKDGRLGHDDYTDRQVPTRIRSFNDEGDSRPRLVAAGDAHSMAVFGDNQVYTWGRGAHGRLGTGRHLNERRPTRVVAWPSSFLASSSRVVAIALGGAHSLVVAEEQCPPSLVDAWGSRRRVYSWGFGANGALGNDRLVHCCRPQLAKMPKWEVITSIAAGRSHSLAVTAHGDLYAWGKGARGELGTGDVRVRVAPFKVPACDTIQVLRVATGDHNTVAIVSKHRSTSRADAERRPLGERASALLFGTPPPLDTVSKLGWCCARSWPPKPDAAVQTWKCATCNIAVVCRWCSIICHAGHALEPAGVHQQKQMCDCGLSVSCLRMPPVVESDPRVGKKAVVLQRAVRGRAARACRRRMCASRRAARTHAASETWRGPAMLGSVWQTLRVVYERKAQGLEQSAMRSADDESLASRRYVKLQIALQAIEAQLRALRRICSKTGAPDPALADNSDVRFRSVRALRQWHRRHSRTVRLRPDALRRWADVHNLSSVDDHRLDLGLVPDPDVCLFALGAAAAAIGDVDAEASRQLRRRASLAAPECLSQRLRWLRLQQRRRLAARRHHSLHPRTSDDKMVTSDDAAAFDELPPIFYFRSRRSVAEAAEDSRDSDLRRAYREGVAASLDEMRKVYGVAIEAAADGAHPARAGLARSSVLPGMLFVAPHPRPTPKLVDFRARRHRSMSVAAPERLAAMVQLRSRYEAVMRGQRTDPTKHRFTQTVRQQGPIQVRERGLTFANIDDGTGTPADDNAVAADVTLSKADWEEQARLIEIMAANAGRRHWLMRDDDDDDDYESSESDRASADAPAPAPGGADGPTDFEMPAPESTPRAPDVTGDDTVQDATTPQIQYDNEGQAWIPLVDETGQSYYFNETTGESSWYPWSTTTRAPVDQAANGWSPHDSSTGASPPEG